MIDADTVMDPRIGFDSSNLRKQTKVCLAGASAILESLRTALIFIQRRPLHRLHYETKNLEDDIYHSWYETTCLVFYC